MMTRKLMWALLGCGAGALLAFGCRIEEREYNPNISTAVQGLASPEQCKTYCAAVQSSCTGAYALYLPDDSDADGIADDCMAICQKLPAGAQNPTSLDRSNSIECRQRQAVAALSEESEDTCVGAGPGGSGRCGETCETYCSLRQSICGDQPGEDTDQERCLQGCPALEPGNIYNSDPLSKEDTLQCRLNHLVFASRSADMAKTHCPHTSLVPQRKEGSDPPCADQSGTPGSCSSYCKLVTSSCRDANRVYESEDQCLQVCKAFPLGLAEEKGANPGENTVACRRYHAYAALGPEGPTVHCPHAGPTGDGHCGAPREENNCFSYCRVLKRACPTRFFQLYLPSQMPPPAASLVDNAETSAEDLGSCMASCKNVPGNEPESRYSVERALKVDSGDDQGDPQGDRGDVLQCRMFHAIRALAGSTGNSPAPSECAAALGDGDCQ
jgi:hypothetical protein